jgi:CheY-like chemotaxis protein
MGKTLLLADDSVTIQKVVGISFASEDIAITTVDNGDDAIAKARELRPDMVLADVVMPGKNGYEVCEAIKADPSLQHIPVLLLTGTFEAFDEERAEQASPERQRRPLRRLQPRSSRDPLRQTTARSTSSKTTWTTSRCRRRPLRRPPTRNPRNDSPRTWIWTARTRRSASETTTCRVRPRGRTSTRCSSPSVR